MGACCAFYDLARIHSRLKLEQGHFIWHQSSYLAMSQLSANVLILIIFSYLLENLELFRYMVIWNILLDKNTTGENSWRGRSPACVRIGLASLLLIMKRGNRVENIEPLSRYDCGILVRIARGRPNPKKYGQLFSIKCKRLWSSQPSITIEFVFVNYEISIWVWSGECFAHLPWLNHLYSKE